MFISATQTFLILVAVFAVAGMRRGWGQEVVTLAIVLGSVLFLSNGGADYLSQMLFVTMPNTLHQTTSGQPVVDPPPSPYLKEFFTAGLFGWMTWLGYRVGTKHGAPAKSHNHRIAGLIPGGINGAAIAYYVTHSLLPAEQVTMNTPSADQTASYLPVVFGLGLVGLLAVLFVSAQNSKGK